MTAAGLHPRAPKWTPAERRRWPNFSPEELSCKGTGEYYHSPSFLDKAQALRNAVGPLRINSAHRSRAHNRRVGGASASAHLTIALDISLEGHDRVRLFREAVKCGFIGLGLGGSFLHVDTWRARVFHYPGEMLRWTRAFGYDPKARFAKTGSLTSI